MMGYAAEEWGNQFSDSAGKPGIETQYRHDMQAFKQDIDQGLGEVKRMLQQVAGPSRRTGGGERQQYVNEYAPQQPATQSPPAPQPAATIDLRTQEARLPAPGSAAYEAFAEQFMASLKERGFYEG
jgi:hypothetical protein